MQQLERFGRSSLLHSQEVDSLREVHGDLEFGADDIRIHPEYPPLHIDDCQCFGLNRCCIELDRESLLERVWIRNKSILQWVADTNSEVDREGLRT